MGHQKNKGKKNPKSQSIHKSIKRIMAHKHKSKKKTKSQKNQKKKTAVVAIDTYPQIEIQDSPDKSRILCVTQDFSPSDLIFSEQAFVSASYVPEKCTFCHQEHHRHEKKCQPSKYYRQLQPNVDEILNYMIELEAVADLDRARTVLACCALAFDNPEALAPVLALAQVGLDRCHEAVGQLVTVYPTVLPASLTVRQLSQTLAALNTNCHELEHVRGSALFLTTCMMEHACVPNCNFTTYGHEIRVVALEPLAKGTALSLDYGNFFYTPLADRQAHLRRSYEFDCACESCQPGSSDRFRPVEMLATCCETRRVFYPTMTMENHQVWTCFTCNSVMSRLDQARVEKAEDALRQRLDVDWEEADDDDDDATLEGLDRTIARFFKRHDANENENANDTEDTGCHFPNTHYLIFWALDALGRHLLLSGERARAIPVWLRLIATFERVLGKKVVHSEAIIYYDELAQLYVATGELDCAKHWFSRAHELSCVLSGPDAGNSLHLAKLVENVPRNTVELMQRYRSSSSSS